MIIYLLSIYPYRYIFLCISTSIYVSIFSAVSWQHQCVILGLSLSLLAQLLWKTTVCLAGQGELLAYASCRTALPIKRLRHALPQFIVSYTYSNSVDKTSFFQNAQWSQGHKGINQTYYREKLACFLRGCKFRESRWRPSLHSKIYMTVYFYILPYTGLTTFSNQKLAGHCSWGVDIYFQNCTLNVPLGGPVLKASGRVQYTPFQLGYKSSMITDQHATGGSVSQLSQLAKLSPWLTLSTKDITTSFWHYNKWFWLLCNQIMGLYHFSNPLE